MAFPTSTHTATTLASFLPDLWGERINDFFRSKLVMASFFVDRSSDLTEGGDVLYTPNMTEMAATAKSDATAVTLNTMGALIVQLKHSIMEVYEMLYLPSYNTQTA